MPQTCTLSFMLAHIDELNQWKDEDSSVFMYIFYLRRSENSQILQIKFFFYPKVMWERQSLKDKKRTLCVGAEMEAIIYSSLLTVLVFLCYRMALAVKKKTSELFLSQNNTFMLKWQNPSSECSNWRKSCDDVSQQQSQQKVRLERGETCFPLLSCPSVLICWSKATTWLLLEPSFQPNP